jgi:hypothetical protein
VKSSVPRQSLQDLAALIGIGLAGIALRYGACYFETGSLSVKGYIDALCQWDCRWISNLAEHGYELQAHANGEANWAFSPLFPVLLSWFHALTGLSFAACGMVLSQCFIGAAAFLARPLFRDEPGSYWVFCVLLIAGPLSFYYSTGLSEALFVLLTIIVLVCLQRGDYLWAGMAAGLLSATRITGIFILLAIIFQAVVDYRRGTLNTSRALIACLLAPTGLIAFMTYLYFHVGDPLAFAHVQWAWGRSLHSPLFWLRWGLHASPLGFWLVVTAMAALAMSVVVALRGAIGAALFCAASLILAISTGPDSMPRFVAGLAPLTIVAAQILPRPLAVRITVAMLGAAIGAFATMKWIGHAQFLV